jgi:SAM-dependent methyltransferase
LLKSVDQVVYKQLQAGIAGTIEWPIDADSHTISAVCPNCGHLSGKAIILHMLSPGASLASGQVSLLRCATCGCGFVHPAVTADYEAEAAGGKSALAFYLQQGAGLRGIASNLCGLNRPDGTRLLEVGCGFGFGLDFARRALNWTVLGLDPSPFAAAGRECLRLPIESRLLTGEDPDLNERFDVVSASEVIEHVLSPPNFARTLRAALREGGSLVLTTPDVEAVGPTTPIGTLLPLLSVGYHLVLQSAASLATLLQNAGFVDVEIRHVGGGQLSAQCSRAPRRCGVAAIPKTDLSSDKYRRYLRDGLKAVKSDSDLWMGFTARAYREAVINGDHQEAEDLWEMFAAACRRRFDIEFETEAEAVSLGAARKLPETSTSRKSQERQAAVWNRTRQRLPTLLKVPYNALRRSFSPKSGVESRIAVTIAGGSLESLTKREPLCLGPMLLHRALQRLHTGEGRTSVETLFSEAANACARLRRALQLIGSDDGDAEDAGWVASAEELLCAAERGAANVVQRFNSLGPSPGDAAARHSGQVQPTDRYRRRIFVSLVNAAHLEEADRLADAVSGVEARARISEVVLEDDELDVLFCAAAREMQRHQGKAERALELLGQLRSACNTARAAGRGGSALTLALPARETEILALEVLGRLHEANALRTATPDVS